MVTKEELSKELNEMLGTNVEWNRLLEDDLKHIHMLVEDGTLAEPIIKQYVKKHGKSQLERQVDGWYPGKFAGSLL